MKTITATIFALACAMAPAAASASYMSGNTLLTRLQESAPVVERSMAAGYVIGVYDAFSGITHCPPSSVTVGQLIDMTMTWLQARPSTSHQPAETHVMLMLATTWPCKKNGNT